MDLWFIYSKLIIKWLHVRSEWYDLSFPKFAKYLKRRIWLDTSQTNNLDEVPVVPSYYDIRHGQPMKLQLNSVALTLSQKYLPIHKSYRCSETCQLSWMVINLVALTKIGIYHVRSLVEVIDRP